MGSRFPIEHQDLQAVNEAVAQKLESLPDLSVAEAESERLNRSEWLGGFVINTANRQNSSPVILHDRILAIISERLSGRLALPAIVGEKVLATFPVENNSTDQQVMVRNFALAVAALLNVSDPSKVVSSIDCMEQYQPPDHSRHLRIVT